MQMYTLPPNQSNQIQLNKLLITPAVTAVCMAATPKSPDSETWSDLYPTMANI